MRLAFITLFTRLAAVVITTAALAGCGSKLEGTYTPEGESFGGALIKSITFKSGDKVELVGAFGVTKEGTFVIEGDKVKITVSGDTTIMTLDSNGCLDGGNMIGKFCKGGKVSGGGTSAKSSGGGGGPSGVYECKGPDGSTYAMEFLSGGRLKMTATEHGHADTTEGTWTVSGDKVTVTSEEGPQTLTIKGNSLEASNGGMTMTFTKK